MINGNFLLQRPLRCQCQFFSHHGPHTATQIGEVHNPDNHIVIAHFAGRHNNSLIHLVFLVHPFQLITVLLGCGKPQGVIRLNMAKQVLEI